MSPSFVLPFQRVWRSCTNTREAKQVSSTDGGINLGSKNSPRRVSYPEEIKICIIWSWPNLRDGVLHVVRMLLCVDVRTFLLHNVQNHAHFANEWKLLFGKTRLQVWALTGPVSLGVDQGRWQQYPHCFSPRFSSRTRTTELPGAGHHVLTKHSGQRCFISIHGEGPGMDLSRRETSRRIWRKVRFFLLYARSCWVPRKVSTFHFPGCWKRMHPHSATPLCPILGMCGTPDLGIIFW